MFLLTLNLLAFLFPNTVILEEMHRILETEFGVQMGELMWGGKDPNRQLHKADDFPQDLIPRISQRRSLQA